MTIEESEIKVHAYFIPKQNIKQALIDIQYNGSYGKSWIKSCDWIPDDNKFFVLVAMTDNYPYLTNKWKIWEQVTQTQDID